MSDKKIVIVIDKCGRPKISTEGYSGDACIKATEGIERALSGGAGIDRTYSPEYYEQRESNELNNQLRW